MMTDLATAPALVCTEEEEAFARLLVKWNGNATRAYREYRPNVASNKCATQMGWDMSSRPQVKARVTQLFEKGRERALQLVPRLVERAREIVEADPAELTSTHVHCCRYCWGEAHRYQFTAREYERKWIEWAQDFDEALVKRKPPPAPFEDGGTGYTRRRGPNEECPECGGQGITSVRAADTRHLSPGAAALFAGAERTKNGIKVNMQDQRAWAEHILKIAGVLTERRELTGAGGGPILSANINANADLSTDDIARVYADLVKC